MTAYSVKTPDGDSGPHSAGEVRAIVDAYRAEHGEDALLRDVTVWELPKAELGNPGKVDVREFLPTET